MAEATGIEDTVEGATRERTATGGSLLESVTGDNIGNVVQTSVEQSVRNAIVTAGNEIIVSSKFFFCIIKFIVHHKS